MPAHSRDDEMLPSDVTSFLASFRKSLLTAQTALEEKVNRNAKRESFIAGLQVPHDHAEGEDSGHPQRLALADSIIAKLDASLAQLLPESELDLLQSHDAAQAAKVASLERCAKEERLEEGRRRREGPEAELEGSPSDVVVSPSDAAGKERKNAAKSLVSFSTALRDADVTLCAETIYDARSYPAHVAMLERCVRAPDGVALIAAKRYYFGVGGGTRAFAEALAESGAFECDVAATYADGASNVREILRVRRRNAERGGDGNPTDAKRAKGTRAGDGGPSRDT